ncbi:hypothetical protein B7G68_09050 [Caulobacter segnis]|uniref:RND efflux system, outer membrane lipoprotein, NodT family n=2 Tax=Caulobacter segnis TaxID=88688 RepID=D5VGB9_CAUST|nr:efflux transporter outer membrane subunit [Caulobacter segnis]ADG10238.1 RND efflux system, outer membrane lipoprotein, NodT family [Caulobacter segnis ATCC 21756]AVQ01978.1 hypothetical protein B7G68_09050 [Caulobacter segnis]
MDRLLAVAPVFALLVSACAAGPNYNRPPPAVAAAWQAPVPHGGDSGKLLAWWSGFDDPILTSLQASAEKTSPSLDQAIANIDKARATLTTQRAAALPNLTGSTSRTKSRQESAAGGATISKVSQAALDASWEIDLFGKARRNVEAARARIEARTDDWHEARISLAAEVADDYVQLRGCEQLAEVLRQATESQETSARLIRLNADAGFSPASDAALADASAASTRSSFTDQRGQCDLLVKSLASLTGLEEPALRTLMQPSAGVLPAPRKLDVTSVPADLVRQRPDVASSERELAATSAEIGAAVADLYPSLTLSGSISTSAGLQQWSFGPSLSLPIFDGGQRLASVRSARASYAYQLAAYRQAVRDAVLDVEQALVQLNVARQQQGDAETAARGYQASFKATDQLYRAGASDLLDRESARRNALDAEQSLINVRLTEIRQWIALYKALGGGWDASNTALAATGDHQP